MERYVTLIRHGMTAGNRLKRYIGSTDECLCGEGIRQIEKLRAEGKYPSSPRVEVLASSPMLRCLQTAGLIYPNRTLKVVEDLRECDFGTFENRNYLEMSDYAPYRQWIDSNGVLPFPGGESGDGFRSRCREAARVFLCGLWEQEVRESVLVIHGGTVMSIMEGCSTVVKDYYDWGLGNGCSLRTRLLDPFVEERCLEPIEMGEETR